MNKQPIPSSKRPGLSSRDYEQDKGCLLTHVSSTCSGSIEFDELLEGLAPPPNPRRRSIILEAFKVGHLWF